jgi:alcohol dehydrogenase
LRAFSIPERDIPEMAEDASKIERLLNNNPRKLTLKEIEQIYQAAY